MPQNVFWEGKVYGPYGTNDGAYAVQNALAEGMDPEGKVLVFDELPLSGEVTGYGTRPYEVTRTVGTGVSSACSGSVPGEYIRYITYHVTPLPGA